MYDAVKFCLVGKIKGLAEQSQYTRALVSKTEKKERKLSLCLSMKSIGFDARHHLLAYGFLKGIPYKSIEAKCRADNKPSAEQIRCVLAVNFWPGMMDREFTAEKVNAWLKDETYQPAPQPKRVKIPYVRKES